MNLQEYIDGLVTFAKENPEALDMQVVSSQDDEGNRYNLVYYEPSLGHYDSDGDFIHSSDEEGIEDYPINAVCIN